MAYIHVMQADRSILRTFWAMPTYDIIYEAKVLTAGITKDSYSITEWVEEPSIVPDIKWNNFIIHGEHSKLLYYSKGQGKEHCFLL